MLGKIWIDHTLLNTESVLWCIASLWIWVSRLWCWCPDAWYEPSNCAIYPSSAARWWQSSSCTNTDSFRVCCWQCVPLLRQMAACKNVRHSTVFAYDEMYNCSLVDNILIYIRKSVYCSLNIKNPTCTIWNQTNLSKSNYVNMLSTKH